MFSGGYLKTPVFGRLRPETGFDLHCVVGLAVQLAEFCAVAAGKFGKAEPAALRFNANMNPRLSETIGRAIGGVESCGKWGGFGEVRRGTRSYPSR
jgi:hypothetical protein